ncbi:MAG: nicotinate-nucleotide--dimethylbenzimidazole phosphoribosyltransferase [Nitrospinae bacterium CG11_big_fil_rev_8_21_14_0_20_56_8]|nr:MAG: nicotinate-nucleotide--dimethylbenzimidazole phosphoribosyltransferase [Nitrospinae bacterium CG11_big_fil_rev_8_21_14_0_20_56_8]
MHPTIRHTLDQISPVSGDALLRAQSHLDSLTKPPGSLGRLEEMAARYVALRGNLAELPKKKAIVVFAADHGVTQEGVSAYPQEVTCQMVKNFLSGGAAVNVLARHAGAEVLVVDMGVNGDFSPHPNLLARKIAPGTQNLARTPAMTRDQAETAIRIGIEIATEWAENQGDLLGTGDMGIGNTTPATAILSVLGNSPSRQLTGRGTGIDNPTLEKKIRLIENAIATHKPNPEDPIDILAKLGGFEIGGIAGLVLGAAARRIPILIDGLISGAGAALALGLSPTVKDYLFPSHRSCEPGHEIFFKLLGRPPILDLDMRLGEGTGAALAIPILEGAIRIYNEMATFKSAGVSTRAV